MTSQRRRILSVGVLGSPKVGNENCRQQRETAADKRSPKEQLPSWENLRMVPK